MPRSGTRSISSLAKPCTTVIAGWFASVALVTGADQRPPPVLHGYEVVNVWPHDPAAYTQGLVYADGALYESTGQYGASGVRVVELTTGKVRQRTDLPSRYFGEGIAVLDGKIFQLTWRSRTGFIYSQDGLKPLGEFRYEGEGWGLTTDGRWLIVSDGTNRLRFLDAHTFNVQRRIEVFENGQPLINLNELEYIHGEIYANVWQRDVIARIDPQTGRLLGLIDLSGLAPIRTADAVLNGIAYDRARDRIFVTGKLWPKLFEIRLKEK